MINTKNSDGLRDVIRSTRPSAEVIAKRSRELNICSISDVHLGHPATSTQHILQNLRRYGIPFNETSSKLDLILIGGDLFDGALPYASRLIAEIERWIVELLQFCAKHGIVLRVLEGTPSHDRNQSSHFVKLASQHQIPVDMKYITEISVEEIESLGISMLYVPDFTSPDPDWIWQRVNEALGKAGRESVDYANIHGGFTYQLPSFAHASCHGMDRYLSIVDNYIFSGHIHVPSIYERIYCNGSFDRLNHGEEEAKGHWRAKIRPSGEDDFTFLINEGAKIYHTADIRGMELDAALTFLDATAAKLRPASAIRIQLERGHPLFTNIARLKNAHPQIVWSTMTVDQKEMQKTLLTDLRESYTEITLTPENIVEFMKPRLEKSAAEPQVVARALVLLEEMRTSCRTHTP